MASLSLEVVVGEGGDKHVKCAISYKPEGLLSKDLTPYDICDLYFRACREQDSSLWLATLHPGCNGASCSSPGPFFAFNWDKGRARAEKYQVEYQPTGAVQEYTSEDAEPVMVLDYRPVYGGVPGYTAGQRIGGEDVTIKLRKVGGVDGSWRILQGAF